MQFSEEQKVALERIDEFPFYRPMFMGGYAGTGKTTVLAELLRRYGRDKIMFLAPTGKACHVLKQKMPNADVRTIHSALYSAHEISELDLEEYRRRGEEGDEASMRLYEYYTRKDALRVKFTLSPTPELFTRLVVVDEASMVARKEYSNLVDVTQKLLFVGDPAQLPPVESPSILPDTFDVFLKKVHRAALESPITRLAMEIRQGEFKGWHKWIKEGVPVIHDFRKATFKAADQILTMKRVTRAYVNRRMRHELFNGIVVPGLTEGEKIIVRQNRKLGEGRFLVNGDIGTVIHRSKEKKDTITVKFTEDEHTFRFSDEELQQNYGDGIPVYPRQPYNVRIDYGYAVTVHASQGSEWGKVLLCDDGMWAWREEQRRKLLYTAVTRAKQKLVVFDARG